MVVMLKHYATYLVRLFRLLVVRMSFIWSLIMLQTIRLQEDCYMRTHCMNLIMKDMSEMHEVADLVTLASRIIRPGATRFDTAFIALKSLCDHKHDLQTMVTSPDYKKVMYTKGCIGKKKELRNFFATTESCTPRILTSLKIGGIGCCVRVFMLLLIEIRGGWGAMDMIERYSSAGTVDGLTLMDQLKLSREHEGTFGRKLALASRNTTHPLNYNEWWKLHDGDAPELQKFAIRILSQTAASSGCEMNWSVFERIHTKRRNRLKDYKKSYDPIDYESIDKIEFWVVDEIPEGELNYNELENMIEEEPPNYNESTMFESQASQVFLKLNLYLILKMMKKMTMELRYKKLRWIPLDEN
uniref:HAT C-terminal dimerisation domain-containing protein n=1 Tax=Lactuca sativa TaxID=4236 RepID=A0A9R1XQ47_LACSA|nr:hypothetical protein LSAT_V11C200062380 [Lactuca sativa]